MSLATRAMLLILSVSVCAGAQTRKLALYVGPANGLDAESGVVMQSELQRLLAPAGIGVVWKNSTERKSGEDFDLVAVSSFDGSCSVVELPSIQVSAVEPDMSLADTSISNGRILPFLHVDCARLVRMLRSELGPLALRSRHAVLGRALGRVIAHEIYHIVAQTTDHDDTGVTKAALSARDLTTPRFDFNPWSIVRMRPPSVARSSGSEDAAAGR
jgi:hypothetical protein